MEERDHCLGLMEEDADFALALHLQQQFEEELREECISVPESTPNQHKPIASKTTNSPQRKRLRDIQLDRYSDNPSSVVDESWELVDPNPDIYSLFQEFNWAFFWGKLEGVEVRWSPRMTSCAGICCYEGRGGLCSVRLSVPLLKLRPRKDLVQTLLHEMIHAYLFVTDNNKDHDGHGPEFHKHMYRINKITGANITVYHTFHDEVNLYKQHWWRCNGPCKDRKPFYGYIKRASNRAPAPNDFWWAEHKKTCNGEFIKIKEPENYKNKKEKGASNVPVPEKKQKTDGSDIRTFFKTSPPKLPALPTASNVHTFSSPVKRSTSSNTRTSPGKKRSSSSNTKTSPVKTHWNANGFGASALPTSSNVHTFSSSATRSAGSNTITIPVKKKNPSSSTGNTKTSPVKNPWNVNIFGGNGHVLGRNNDAKTSPIKNPWNVNNFGGTGHVLGRKS